MMVLKTFRLVFLSRVWLVYYKYCNIFIKEQQINKDLGLFPLLLLCFWSPTTCSEMNTGGFVPAVSGNRNTLHEQHMKPEIIGSLARVHVVNFMENALNFLTCSFYLMLTVYSIKNTTKFRFHNFFLLFLI